MKSNNQYIMTDILIQTKLKSKGIEMSNTTVDLSAIGISAETQAKAPAQDIKSRTWSSQVAKCIIKEAAVFKTASGATMFKLSIENENGDKYEEYANTKYIAKADDKDGKFKAGDEVENMAGVSLVTALVAATGCTDIAAKPAKFKAYAVEEQEGMALTGIINKIALFAIREIHTEGAQYPQSNEISLITDLDGNNAKGEEVMSKFVKLIETNPILNRKAKDGATTAAATAGSAEAKDAVKNMKF